MDKSLPDVGVCRVIRHLIGQRPIRENTQKQHRGHRADGAQRHQTEAVLLTFPVAQNPGDTHAQCHNERDCDWAGGDAAGIKSQRQQRQFVIHRKQQCQGEQQHIKQHEKLGKGFAKHDFQNGGKQEQSHADAHGVNQHRAVHHRAHLICQHLQIRLRNGNQHPQHKTDRKQKPQLSLPGKSRAHMGAHGCHGQIRAQIEHTDPQHQRCRADGKAPQLRPGEIEQWGQRQKINNRRNRKRRNQRLPDFCPKRVQIHHLSHFISFKSIIPEKSVSA